MAFKKGHKTWNKGIHMWESREHPRGTLGKKASLETRKKMSITRKGRKYTDEHKKRISVALLGKVVSEEAKKNMSMAKIGLTLPEEHKKNIGKSISGGKNGMWKADDVGYSGLHKWVAQWLGKPNKCEFCEKIGYGLGMHWANKDHSYQRNLIDWLRLCPQCHKKYDISNFNLQVA